MQIGSVNFTPIATNVSYADSVALDSFGRLRVSSPTTLFDAQQEYGLDTLRVWDGSKTGQHLNCVHLFHGYIQHYFSNQLV